MNNQGKACVMYDRDCINCGECEICDLDPNKKCDNCGKCIEDGADYSTVDVELINENGDEPLNYKDDFDDNAEEDDVSEDFRRDFGELFGDLDN